MHLYEVISYFNLIGRQKSIVFATNEQQAKELVASKLKFVFSAFTFESVKVIPMEIGVVSLEYLDDEEDDGPHLML